MKILISELKNICVNILIKKGLSKKDSIIIFNDFLNSELEGKSDHGFQSFIGFGAKLDKPTGFPKVIKQTDSIIYIDGNRNFGQVVCDKYIPILIKKAKKNGIAMMGIKNMHSFRAPGTYAKLMAKKDLIGIVTNYGGWPRIAPTGSIDPMFGTNPIAIGIPSKNNPIVLDMATSKVALMKIRMAKKLNKKIPLGWAIDKNGNSTTDPEEAMNGAVLPFGDYKGSGLALMIELLTKTMFNIDIKNKNKANRGFLFICFNPAIFQNIGSYKSKVSILTKKIKKSRKAKGVKEIFIPGEQANNEIIKNIKKDWIELDRKVFKEIVKFKNII